jgi:hypothetical protein
VVGQIALGRFLRTAGFAFQIQNRPEPYGHTLDEAMAAGAVVVASPVGCFAERVRDGDNGFLVAGDQNDSAVHDLSAEIILDALSRPEQLERIRARGIESPFDWSEVACALEAHWGLLLDPDSSDAAPLIDQRCPNCAAAMRQFPDGVRCTACSFFRPAPGGGRRPIHRARYRE